MIEYNENHITIDEISFEEGEIIFFSMTRKGVVIKGKGVITKKIVIPRNLYTIRQALSILLGGRKHAEDRILSSNCWHVKMVDLPISIEVWAIEEFTKLSGPWKGKQVLNMQNDELFAYWEKNIKIISNRNELSVFDQRKIERKK